MKKLLLAAALLGSLMSDAQTSWAPAGERIKTRWAAEVDPAAPLPEYPRPILVREQWMNLNGLWNYSLTSAGAACPGETLGEILVPFPIESALSGVQRRVSEKEALWYETTFEVPAAWRKGNDILLHFGAVAISFLSKIPRAKHKRPASSAVAAAGMPSVDSSTQKSTAPARIKADCSSFPCSLPRLL